jgi:metal-responsive CopG/Arc/MetJ family transcriptional regulator
MDRLVVMIPSALKNRFHRAVKNKGCTMRFVLAKLIQQWLEENHGK